MANQFRLFNEAVPKFGNGTIDLDSDTIKWAFITDAYTPDAPDANPCWGSGGTTDLSVYEVTPGGTYPAGGVALTSVTYAQAGGTTTFDSDDLRALDGRGEPDQRALAGAVRRHGGEQGCARLRRPGRPHRPEFGRVRVGRAVDGLVLLCASDGVVMAQQTINIGAAANDGTGDPARTAFGKVNDNFTELYAQSGHGVIGSTVTTKQDDYAPAGWAACRTLRWNGAGSTGFTGLDATGLADGAERIITNASTDYLLWLENENTASSAANRMMLPKGFPAFLMPGDSITLQYDATAQRWRVTEWPNQGSAMGFSEWSDNSTVAFWATASGTGSTAVAQDTVTASQHSYGQAQVRTGTTTGGYAYRGSTFGAIRSTSQAIFVSSRVRVSAAPDATDTWTGIVGLASAIGVLTDAIAWELRWNGSAAEWSRLTMNNSSATRDATNAPSVQTTSWLVLGVYLNAAGNRSDFLLSTDGVAWTLAGSLSTNITASNRSLSCMTAYVIKSAGTASRGLDIEWEGIRVGSVVRT